MLIQFCADIWRHRAINGLTCPFVSSLLFHSMISWTNMWCGQNNFILTLSVMKRNNTYRSSEWLSLTRGNPTLQFLARPSSSKTYIDSWWFHQMGTVSALQALCAGNSLASVKSSHKGQRRGALMFSLICTRTTCCANNGNAGDLGHHYDVTAMFHSVGSVSARALHLNKLCIGRRR